MVYLSDGVKDSVRSLCYYPYTIGKHLDKINQTLSNIYLAFTHLTDSTYLIKRIIQNVGSIWYFKRNGNTYIERVSWSSVLTKFYYVKSNFITSTTVQRNISSVNPSQYEVRDEPYFRCDNDFKVVSRNYRGRQLFNFIDISDGFARIVSDIDFIQVKPFSEYKI